MPAVHAPSIMTQSNCSPWRCILQTRQFISTPQWIQGFSVTRLNVYGMAIGREASSVAVRPI
jgi:hypothetical protein